MRHLFVSLLALPLLFACSSAPDRPEPDQLLLRSVEFEGGRVAYEDFGRGDEALLFVHGWACDMTFWRYQVPALSYLTRLIAVDLPGHGRSDPPLGELDMDTLARSLVAVLDHAGVEKALLVGHSNGTQVVRAFQRRFPERTRGLVTVDGALKNLFPQEQVEAMAAPLRGENYLDVASGFVRGMLGSRLDESLRSEVEERMLQTPQEIMVASLLAASAPENDSQDPIEVPLLAIHARAPFWTEEYEAYVRDLAPDCDYVVLDGVGHFLMLEDPEGFNELIDRFVRERF